MNFFFSLFSWYLTSLDLDYLLKTNTLFLISKMIIYLSFSIGQPETSLTSLTFFSVLKPCSLTLQNIMKYFDTEWEFGMALLTFVSCKRVHSWIPSCFKKCSWVEKKKGKVQWLLIVFQSVNYFRMEFQKNKIRLNLECNIFF